MQLKNSSFGFFRLIFILIGLVHPCLAQKKAVSAKSPNIIIILADDMGYGDISTLNPDSKIRTPSLDKLVQQGISFTNAHSSASVCTPSRYGLLTGRYAFRSKTAAYGIGGFDRPVIEEERETLASTLKKSGYATAVIGKWHLGLDWQTKDGLPAKLDQKTGYSNVDYSKEVKKGPNNVGFDYSFIHPASLDIPPYVFLRNHKVIDPDIVLTTSVYPVRKERALYAWDKKHTDSLAVYWEKGVWWRQGEMSKSFRIETCQSTIVREGIAFIDSQVSKNAAQPFFLYLPLTGPHTPWMPGDKFRGKSDIGLYGDFVMEIDDIVAQIRETLIRNKIDENTLIIFASDNGAYWPEEEIKLQGHNSNSGTKGQKGDVWDGGHRIPLIMSWPEEIPGNAQYPHLLSLTDFFATLSDLLGLVSSENQGRDSESFSQVFRAEWDKPHRNDMVHHSSGNLYGIRVVDWKFIEGLGSGGFTVPAHITPEIVGPTGQLYQISSDPREQENLFLKYPEKVAELSNLMNKITNRD
ncbi:Arylsulfatase A [Algoriphagus alkaliphilus]|uniref:Arylsulfatase A n=1 Tax=Algoriphagus alkaliphilus TaxID=279824 RepID=A0A1G5VNJ4_9BACT|nr:arylsulfatase [Algoriphagus alkaliphilus]SDA47471.1 Arylsulfatase A [Algoriphagus alkaliphilus]